MIPPGGAPECGSLPSRLEKRPHNALYNYGRMQEVWLDT
jgi:hypothetical protein